MSDITTVEAAGNRTGRPIIDVAGKRTRKGTVLTDRLCETKVTKRKKYYDRRTRGLYVSITGHRRDARSLDRLVVRTRRAGRQVQAQRHARRQEGRRHGSRAARSPASAPAIASRIGLHGDALAIV
jgi:hypothetical protein